MELNSNTSNQIKDPFAKISILKNVEEFLMNKETRKAYATRV